LRPPHAGAARHPSPTQGRGEKTRRCLPFSPPWEKGPGVEGSSQTVSGRDQDCLESEIHPSFPTMREGLRRFDPLPSACVEEGIGVVGTPGPVVPFPPLAWGKGAGDGGQPNARCGCSTRLLQYRVFAPMFEKSRAILKTPINQKQGVCCFVQSRAEIAALEAKHADRSRNDRERRDGGHRSGN
jgi:hypothetical protein